MDKNIIVSYFISLFKDYSPNYEHELYERISNETKNKIRLEQKLEIERNKRDLLFLNSTKDLNVQHRMELEKKAERQLDIEIEHQKEEVERRTLATNMMSDVENNSPNFSKSCAKLLNNYQGLFFIFMNFKFYLN